jgi:hypothetical protein
MEQGANDISFVASRDGRYLIFIADTITVLDVETLHSSEAPQLAAMFRKADELGPVPNEWLKTTEHLNYLTVKLTATAPDGATSFVIRAKSYNRHDYDVIIDRQGDVWPIPKNLEEGKHPRPNGFFEAAESSDGELLLCFCGVQEMGMTIRDREFHVLHRIIPPDRVGVCTSWDPAHHRILFAPRLLHRDEYRPKVWLLDYETGTMQTFFLDLAKVMR